MPGICTSSSTSANSSASRRRRASGPETAATVRMPRGASVASSATRFAGRSSTRSTDAGRQAPSLVPPPEFQDRPGSTIGELGKTKVSRPRNKPASARACYPGNVSGEPAPPDPRIGATLQGRYLILAKLASGAMGVVYRGERVQLGRAVAVKFLHPWIAAQKTFLSRFENEAKAMSRLLHPHCVSVIDFGVEGSPYLVRDFVTGRTLRDLMLEGRLPATRVMRLAQQLLAGLAHAHAQGIVHRDLKPENLILSEEAGLQEHLRILDFGLAKLRDGPQMTAGMAVGTPSYMSPEQSGAEGAIDARTDLYTVGVVLFLFEMSGGRKPFQSDNVGEVILMQRESPPPKLRSVAADAHYSEELEALLDKAMSKLPEDRFQSAAELAAALAGTPEGSAAGLEMGIVGKPLDAKAQAKKADAKKADAKKAQDKADAKEKAK